MTLLLQTDWEPVLKLYGPMGVIFLLAVIAVVGAAKWFKSTLEGTITDARSERDAARRYNETMSARFLESLDKRDEVMEKGFDEVLRELRNNSPRRK